jgi:hypothetical protein
MTADNIEGLKPQHSLWPHCSPAHPREGGWKGLEVAGSGWKWLEGEVVPDCSLPNMNSKKHTDFVDSITFINV